MNLMRAMALVLFLLSLVVLALPIAALANVLSSFADGDFKVPEMYFVLSVLAWGAMAMVEWVLLRTIRREPPTWYSMVWFFGMSSLVAILLTLALVGVVDYMHYGFGEGGLGVVFSVAAMAGTVFFATGVRALQSGRLRNEIY